MNMLRDVGDSFDAEALRGLGDQIRPYENWLIESPPCANSDEHVCGSRCIPHLLRLLPSAPEGWVWEHFSPASRIWSVYLRKVGAKDRWYPLGVVSASTARELALSIWAFVQGHRFSGDMSGFRAGLISNQKTEGVPSADKMDDSGALVQSKEQLLEWWQGIRGSLPPDSRTKFLARCEEPSIRVLLKLPLLVVRPAIEMAAREPHGRLENAVTYALDNLKKQPYVPPAKTTAPSEPSTKPAEAKEGAAASSGENRRAPNSDSKSKWAKRNDYRKHGPTGKPSSSGGLQNTAPAGVPGASASYQSGLVHNPSAPEATTGERCEHCQAHIPNGAVHDKCHG